MLGGPRSFVSPVRLNSVLLRQGSPRVPCDGPMAGEPSWTIYPIQEDALGKALTVLNQVRSLVRGALASSEPSGILTSVPQPASSHLYPSSTPAPTPTMLCCCYPSLLLPLPLKHQSYPTTNPTH